MMLPLLSRWMIQGFISGPRDLFSVHLSSFLRPPPTTGGFVDIPGSLSTVAIRGITFFATILFQIRTLLSVSICGVLRAIPLLHGP